jgi:predicted nucleotidyltransferase
MKVADNEIIQALHKHADVLKKHRVKKIGLFGSYARGDQKPQSDIDLLVEFDLSFFDENFTGYYDNYLGLMSTLRKIFKVKVDLVTDDMISPHIKPLMMDEVRYVKTA